MSRKNKPLNQKGPVILIAGGDSWHSRGDHAILEATIKMLSESIPNADYIILSDKPERTKAQFPSITVTNRRDPLATLRSMRASDVMLWGGGQLVQNRSSKAFLAFHLYLLVLARWINLPIIGFALGVAEVKGSIWRSLVAKMLNRFSAISVRDEKSKQDLVRMGVRVGIEVTADPVLILTPTTADRISSLENLSKPFVIIAPRRWYQYTFSMLPSRSRLGEYKNIDREFRTFIDNLAELADWIVETLSLNILFVPMYPNEPQDDITVIRRVQERMHHGSTTHMLEGFYPINALIRIFAESVLTIGVRLHATIFATCSNTPSIMIYNQIKGQSFFKQIAMDDFCVPIDDVNWDEIRMLIGRILANRSRYAVKIQKKREILLKHAYANANLVKRVLKEKEII